MTTSPEADALFDRVDPNKVGRLDEPPADAVGRSFTVKGMRPQVADWRAFAVANAADLACAGDPLGMTVVRDNTTGDITTTVTIYWAAAA